MKGSVACSTGLAVDPPPPTGVRTADREANYRAVRKEAVGVEEGLGIAGQLLRRAGRAHSEATSTIISISTVMSRGSEDIPTAELVFTTAHQATGALLLAGAALTVLWTRRLLAEA